MSKLLAYFTMAVLLTACNTAKRENDFSYYFDLKSFVEGEALRLQTDSPTVYKLTFLSGKTEAKKIGISNWKKEFAEFLEADINKKANIGKYSIDSSFTNKILNKITYTALDTKLKTSVLTIFFNNDKVSGFDAALETKNTLYQSNQQLHYSVDSGYTIYGGQDVKVYGKDTFAIEVSYLP